MQLYYDETCYIDSKFERKVDSGKLIPMIAEIIRLRYSYVTTLDFNDSSYRDCANKFSVSLATMGYLTTGQTWYQRHFGAYLESNEQSEFEQKHMKFQQLKHTMPWETLHRYMPLRLPIEDNKMKTMFESAQTWQEFFSNLMDTIKAEQMCEFLSLWITEFMVDNMNFNFSMITYFIDIHNIPELSIQILPYTHGEKHRRQTQRSAKNSKIRI